MTISLVLGLVVCGVLGGMSLQACEVQKTLLIM